MTAPTPSAAQVLAPFPQRIMDLLRFVADRNPPPPHGPFEDRDGTPLQDDADAALAWIAAALSTLPAEPEGWRDISTAPKDGTTVILAEGDKAFRGFYMVVPYREVRDLEGQYIDHTDHEEFWMGDADGEVYEPTSWQPERPLPAAPAARPTEPDAGTGEAG